MLEHKLIERLLVNKCLFNLVLVEQEGLLQTLQKKATDEELWLVAKETASCTPQAWLLKRQY